MKKALIRILLMFVFLAAMLPLTAVFPVSAVEKDYRIYDADFDDKVEAEGRIYGYWTAAEDKTGYSVTLYKGDKKIGTRRVGNTSRVDLTSYINSKKGGAGTYTFEVYPVKGGEALTIKSDPLEVTSTMITTIRNRIQQEVKEARKAAGGGWAKGPGDIWIYYDKEGNQVKSAWVEDKGFKYYLDKDGIMSTGWTKINSNYYYLEPKGTVGHPRGSLWVSTTTPDGYQVDDNGMRLGSDGLPEKEKTEKVLTTIPISIKEEKEAGKYTTISEIQCGSGTVSNVAYATDPATWTTDTNGEVSFNITLSNSYRMGPKVKLNCSRANATEVLSHTSQELSAKLWYTPKYVLTAPVNFYISETGNLQWDKVTRAKEYTVKITTQTEEENDEGEVTKKKSTKTLTVTNPNIELGSIVDIDLNSVISVTVTASGDKNKTISSGEAKIDDMEKFRAERTVNGSFERNSVGLRYRDEDGNYVTGWKEILGNWYLFKNTNYAAGPGWYRDSKTDYWYYFDENNRMMTGTVTLSDGTYNLNDGSNPNYPLGAWIH